MRKIVESKILIITLFFLLFTIPSCKKDCNRIYNWDIMQMQSITNEFRLIAKHSDTLCNSISYNKVGFNKDYNYLDSIMANVKNVKLNKSEINDDYELMYSGYYDNPIFKAKERVYSFNVKGGKSKFLYNSDQVWISYLDSFGIIKIIYVRDYRYMKNMDESQIIQYKLNSTVINGKFTDFSRIPAKYGTILHSDADDNLNNFSTYEELYK